MRKSLKSEGVFPLLCEKLQRISLVADLLRSAWCQVFSTVPQLSSLGCLNIQLTSSRGLTSAISKISSVNVASRRPLRSLRGGPGDDLQLWHGNISKARSCNSTRNCFRLLPSKTTAYQTSALPALPRLQVDRYYLQELCLAVSFSPFLFFTAFLSLFGHFFSKALTLVLFTLNKGHHLWTYCMISLNYF